MFLYVAFKISNTGRGPAPKSFFFFCHFQVELSMFVFFFFFAFRLGSLCSESTIPHCRHGEDAEGTGKNCQVSTSHTPPTNLSTSQIHLRTTNK